MWGRRTKNSWPHDVEHVPSFTAILSQQTTTKQNESEADRKTIWHFSDIHSWDDTRRELGAHIIAPLCVSARAREDRHVKESWWASSEAPRGGRKDWSAWDLRREEKVDEYNTSREPCISASVSPVGRSGCWVSHQRWDVRWIRR